MQNKPHLIGQRRAATGPVGRQLALVPLDQILGLTACAVEAVIEPRCGTEFDVGDDVADIETFPRRLDPRHDPAGMRPGFGGIARLDVVAHHIQVGSRTPDAHIVGLGEDLSSQNRVG